MLMIKKWKIETTEEIELLNQESVRTLVLMENDTYLRILEADTIKQPVMKEKNLKRKPQKNKETAQNQTL